MHPQAYLWIWTLISHFFTFLPTHPLALPFLNLLCTIVVISCHWDFWIGSKQAIVPSSPSILISLHFQSLTDFPEICFCTERPEWSDRFTDHDDAAQTFHAQDWVISITRESVTMLQGIEGFRNWWIERQQCIMDQAKVTSCCLWSFVGVIEFFCPSNICVCVNPRTTLPYCINCLTTLDIVSSVTYLLGLRNGKSIYCTSCVLPTKVNLKFGH